MLILTLVAATQTLVISTCRRGQGLSFREYLSVVFFFVFNGRARILNIAQCDYMIVGSKNGDGDYIWINCAALCLHC